mmetsp:Transcript_63173/g.137366  ORF Transcript_63173/g.137366 Transcript_63173/m.137366 type:complete len:272 (-) Transcript_63173:32-847(-)
MESTPTTLPSKPCAAMPRKQTRILAAGDEVHIADVALQDRTRVLSEAMIRRKEARCQKTRCARCWFPINNSGTSHCICAKLSPLPFSTKTRFLIYMHPRDWYNAGDDAKLLMCAAPDRTEIVVFGRQGDEERLRSAISAAEAAVILFPDSIAMTIDEFLEGRRTEESTGDVAPEITIIVIDGTWSNAKRVLRHLHEVSPDLPHLRLRPTRPSVYSRTQTRSDGVSSVEAVALLLEELGEEKATCEELVRYVEVNNDALRLRPQLPPETLEK